MLSEATLVYEANEESHSLRRILWRELAERYGLTFHPEITADSFTRNFTGKSWPRYLIGPNEGTLDRETCEKLVNTLSQYPQSQECYFHYDLIATRQYERDLLYEGFLIDVMDTFEMEEVYGTPSHWWPVSRRWFLCTDWDLPISLFGGPEETVEALIANPVLECVRVQQSTRIDYRADGVNPW
jgi:hypothetical protein